MPSSRKKFLKKIKYLILLLVILSCGSRPSSKITYFKVGHLLDPESGMWLNDQVLEVRAGKVTGILSSAPAGSPMVDLGAYYIIPGLIDAHTHLFLEEPTFGKDFAEGLLSFMNTHSDADRLKLGESRGKALLKAGFTSVRDLGNQGEIAKSSLGHIPVRIYSSGPGYAPLDGQLPKGTPEKIIRKEYRLLEKNPPAHFEGQVVKVYADEDPNKNFADDKILTEWVKAAHAQGLKVASHATFPESIEASIRSGVDSIEHGTYVKKDQLQRMSQQGIIFVPTFADVLFLRPEYSQYKKAHTQKFISDTCNSIALAKQQNVIIAFGSDNYFSPGGDFGKETLEVLLALEMCGMTPLEILRAATINAARTISDHAPVGKLSPGHFADFIVLKDDPLKNLGSLRVPISVYREGKEIEVNRAPSSLTTTGWQDYLFQNLIEPQGLAKFFPDPKSLGSWRVNEEFVINHPILPSAIPAKPLACPTKNLYPTHPYQSTKEYLHAVFSMYDHGTLPPTSYACLTRSPNGKFCLRGAVALMVVMSDTYEDDCGNYYRGYWLVTYLKSDESMGTLFAKGRVLYEKPDAQFPGEYIEAGTYIVNASDFFLLGELLKTDQENIRIEEERAIRAGFHKNGKLFVK